MSWFASNVRAKDTQIKTKYVRERGQPPQPYIETVPCTRCDSNGKIVLDKTTKNLLSTFRKHAKQAHKKV